MSDILSEINERNTKLREVVFQALGSASMCWVPTPTGEFDSGRAEEIGKSMIADLAKLDQPNLGMATTQQLINELEARIHFLNYRTIDK